MEDETLLDNTGEANIAEDYNPDAQLDALSAKYDMPEAQQAFALLRRSSSAAQKALQEARLKILARKYNSAIPLLAASAALGAPTRAGSTAESFGAMSGALIDPLREKAAFQQQRENDLLGVDTSLVGIDERLANSAIKLEGIRRRAKAATTAKTAMSVSEYEYWKGLPPKEQRDFLELKRNPNLWTGTVAGIPTVVDPAQRRPDRPLSNLTAEQQAAAALAASKEAGTVTGGAQAKAALDYPKVKAQMDQTLKLVKQLDEHPGLPYAVGKSAYLPIVKGTEPANFITLLNQLKGKQFLEAYETLKGGGQITEVEGKKATDAMARMDVAQSEPAFHEALKDFGDVIRAAVKRASERAANVTAVPGIVPSATAKRLKFDKLGNRIE